MGIAIFGYVANGYPKLMGAVKDLHIQFTDTESNPFIETPLIVTPHSCLYQEHADGSGNLHEPCISFTPRSSEHARRSALWMHRKRNNFTHLGVYSSYPLWSHFHRSLLKDANASSRNGRALTQVTIVVDPPTISRRLRSYAHTALICHLLLLRQLFRGSTI